MNVYLERYEVEFSNLDKRVGILDIPWINNFGACLISYALQVALTELGYRPEIINYDPNRFSSVVKKNYKRITKFKRKISLKVKDLVGEKLPYDLSADSKYAEKFDIFRLRYLTYSKPCDVEFTFNKPIYPRYVVGSDVVWKPARIASYEKEAYFLKFAPKNAIKVAYAASIGTNDYETLKPVEEIFKKNLLEFDAISIREQESADYIRQMTSIKVERCIDPTLLLDASEYAKLADSVSDVIEEEYIFLYSLGGVTEEVLQYVSALARKKGIRIAYYGMTEFPGDKELLIKDCITDGPLEFLNRIKNAQAIITDSFHGTVFSVIFHKPFYTYGRGNISIRMVDLLNLLNIQECFVTDFKDLPVEYKAINYENIDRLILEERKNGIEFLSASLATPKGRFSKGIPANDKSQCCGCGACVANCPKNCIEMCYMQDGAKYAVNVKKKDCIACGLCEAVCPILNRIESKKEERYYAVKHKDSNIAWKSTSGGLFSALASTIINNSGYVYAACFDDNMTLAHHRAECLEELDNMRGSKYVQCDDNPMIFKEIKEFVERGRQVLYVGTPCQCAALTHYIGEIKENLLLVDFVCHGTPGHNLWKKYLLDYHKKAVSNATFRTKKEAWRRGPCIFHIDYKDGTEYNRLSIEDPYYNSFLQGVSLRDSCFTCAFKKFASGSDITLGDFWGIEKRRNDLYSKEGVSLCITHSEKGESFLKEIEALAEIFEVDKEDAIPDNIRIVSSMPYNIAKIKFNQYISQYSYQETCNRTFGLKYVLVEAKRAIKRLLYR